MQVRVFPTQARLPTTRDCLPATATDARSAARDASAGVPDALLSGRWSSLGGKAAGVRLNPPVTASRTPPCSARAASPRRA
ncbi:MAG TPA: hypothetical protein PLR85_19710, partial [Nitrospira sp.]|nr:hypothetical protein [Nitrospira sp.]